MFVIVAAVLAMSDTPPRLREEESIDLPSPAATVRAKAVRPKPHAKHPASKLQTKTLRPHAHPQALTAATPSAAPTASASPPVADAMERTAKDLGEALPAVAESAGAVADAQPQTPPTPAPASAARAEDDPSNIPSGAPQDDYGLVSWCQGALSGHMALYELVKPQLDALEQGDEAKSNAKLDAEQLAAGRDYLSLYAKARQAFDQTNAGAQFARGESAKDQGLKMWIPVRSAPPTDRMWSWLGWELPARCETAAKRLVANSDILSEMMRARPGTDAPETVTGTPR